MKVKPVNVEKEAFGRVLQKTIHTKPTPKADLPKSNRRLVDGALESGVQTCGSRTNRWGVYDRLSGCQNGNPGLDRRRNVAPRQSVGGMFWQ